MSGRFAPSTTGVAHVGTMFSALLAWADARSANVPFVLRMENLDPKRCRLEHAESIEKALRWLGVDWDKKEQQTENVKRYELALDQLCELGRVYCCQCSRRKIREDGVPAVDGGVVYPGTCRGNLVENWRETEGVLRFSLETKEQTFVDGVQGPQNACASQTLGDPVVRGRDGYAYALVVVVDDGAVHVDRVVRGQDLLPHTVVQMQLIDALGLPVPQYWHHPLLLQAEGGKFSKSHDAVPYTYFSTGPPAAMIGWFARLCGLTSGGSLTAREFVREFSWDRIGKSDIVVSNPE